MSPVDYCIRDTELLKFMQVLIFEVGTPSIGYISLLLSGIQRESRSMKGSHTKTEVEDSA